MDCQGFNERLADLVGGELDAATRDAALDHMAGCAACRERARGLQAAAAVFESTVPTLSEASRATADLSLPDGAARRPMTLVRRLRIAAAFVRYAAVVALAFGAGYAARSWGGGAGEPAPQPREDAAPISPRIMRNLELAATQFPNSSSFSWSLISLARR